MYLEMSDFEFTFLFLISVLLDIKTLFFVLIFFPIAFSIFKSWAVVPGGWSDQRLSTV
jgi:hypothetical protein